MVESYFLLIFEKPRDVLDPTSNAPSIPHAECSAAAHSPPRYQEDDLVMTDATPPSQSVSGEVDPPAAQSHLNTEASNPRPDMIGVNGKQATGTGHGEPGSAWMTKKFAEEYERTFSQLVDQQFNIGKKPQL